VRGRSWKAGYPLLLSVPPGLPTSFAQAILRFGLLSGSVRSFDPSPRQKVLTGPRKRSGTSKSVRNFVLHLRRHLRVDRAEASVVLETLRSGSASYSTRTAIAALKFPMRLSLARGL